MRHFLGFTAKQTAACSSYTLIFVFVSGFRHFSEAHIICAYRVEGLYDDEVKIGHRRRGGRQQRISELAFEVV